MRDLLNDIVNGMIKKPNKLKLNLNYIIRYVHLLVISDNRNIDLARLRIKSCNVKNDEFINIVFTGVVIKSGTAFSGRLITYDSCILLSGLTISTSNLNANIILNTINLNIGDIINGEANIYV